VNDTNIKIFFTHTQKCYSGEFISAVTIKITCKMTDIFADFNHISSSLIDFHKSPQISNSTEKFPVPAVPIFVDRLKTEGYDEANRRY
jgi:hypothetical protein